MIYVRLKVDSTDSTFAWARVFALIITHFNHAYAINTLFNFVFDIFPFAAAFCNFYVCILNYFILIFIYLCIHVKFIVKFLPVHVIHVIKK